MILILLTAVIILDIVYDHYNYKKKYFKYLFIGILGLLFLVVQHAIYMSFPAQNGGKLGNEIMGYNLQSILKQLNTKQLVALGNKEEIQGNPFQLINVAMRIIANDIGMEKDIHKDYGLNEDFFKAMASHLIMYGRDIDSTSKALLFQVFQKDMKAMMQFPKKMSEEQIKEFWNKMFLGPFADPSYTPIRFDCSKTDYGCSKEDD